MCVTNVLSKALMCYQNREVEILNDLNDRDLNDRKMPLNIYWFF